MGLIRYCVMAALLLFAMEQTSAQKVYYPSGASQLLKSTAADMAMLLQKATGDTQIIAESYTTIPLNGLVLVYDSAAVNDNQSCKVVSDGSGYIQFSAAEDNGLNFGVYQYLQQLGFRFYQPGSIWEITPLLKSAYQKTDTVYSCKFRYKNWFISGGQNTWVMDNNSNYYWDTYQGENGHQWSLYMRRNNMVGANRFAGHRGDIMTADYLATLQQNPCYVAPYNGSRAASTQSVSDVNNQGAMQFWSSSIEKQYSQFKATIFGNPTIYTDYIHNFSYANGYIGIEVPDGSHWANSKDNSGCSNADFLKESDQQFTLGNFTAAAISKDYPGKHFQLYAYDGHADVPAASINIDNNIDIQVVSDVYQTVSSAKGLLNRWYGRSKNISEYHYINLPQWSGETPSFFLDDLKNSVQRIKEKQGEGIVWESSVAKFASLPFLLAANASLKDNASIDSVLQTFCNSFFDQAAPTIYQLLQSWTDDKTVTLTNGSQDNKYKLPYYFQLVSQADRQTSQSSALVKARMNELKAYLHYMVLYYDWAFDQRAPALKIDKAAALCSYLAKINSLQLVNSYFLINLVTGGYSTTDNFYQQFNTINGTAYDNGALQPLTAAEIASNFTDDTAIQGALISESGFTDAATIETQFGKNNLSPLPTISLHMNYTNGKDYCGAAEYYLTAATAGNFSIQYQAQFNMAGFGYANFTVEAVNQTLGVIKDFTVDNQNGSGILTVSIPAAGTYKLTINTKYQTSLELSVNTNGNYFYKNGPFLGNTIENYRGNLLSLPGYFYVPQHVSRVYFSISNSYSATAGFATPATINNYFMFKNNEGVSVTAELANPNDSSLFYLDIPASNQGSFWQAFKMEAARLCFANISNIQWYASKKPCAGLDLAVNFKNSAQGCITQALAINSDQNNTWDIYDASLDNVIHNQQMIELPLNFTENAIIQLQDQSGCSVSKRLGDFPDYLQNKANCAATESAAVPVTPVRFVIYPNPGTGLFKCQNSTGQVTAAIINIFNSAGIQVAHFVNQQEFDIRQLTTGVYIYQVIVNKDSFHGKLVKQ